MKVLQLGGFQSGGPSNTDGGLSPMLGNALGPLAKTLLDTSALMPVVKELMKFADSKSIADLIPAMNRAVEVQEKSNERLVRAAFARYAVDDETVAVLSALADFPFWRSLTRGGMPHAEAVEVICSLVQSELRKRQIGRG